MHLNSAGAILAGMAEIMGHPTAESAWRRGWNDALKLKDKWVWVVLDAIAAGAVGTLLSIQIPDWWASPELLVRISWTWTEFWQAVFGLSVTAGLLLSTFGIFLLVTLQRTPVRQRNEARSLVATDDELDLAVSHNDSLWVGPSMSQNCAYVSTGEIYVTNRSTQKMSLEVRLFAPVPPEARFPHDQVIEYPYMTLMSYESVEDLEHVLGQYVEIEPNSSVRGVWRFLLHERVTRRVAENDINIATYLQDHEPDIEFRDHVNGRRLRIGVSRGH